MATCATCRFFVPDGRASQGQCRRFPPHGSGPYQPGKDREPAWAYGVFPVTVDTAWCGEHAVKGKA